MKTLDIRIAASLLAAATLAAAPVRAQAPAQLDLPRVSQKGAVSQTVGVTRIDVSYCRPGVKGRTIWGGLVPYNEVWRTGANEATTISFSDPVTIEGTTLPAGTYEFATIPGTDAWTLIFNKDKDIWGAYTYRPEHDVLRIKVKPQAAEYTEWMTFSFPGVAADSAEVALTWEKVRVAFTVKVDTNGITLARTRAAVAAAAADDWQTPYRAASYCLQNDVNTDEAVAWLEKSIGVKQTFGNLGAKARYLAKKGDTRGAIDTATKAIEVGRAADPKTDTAALEKLIAEWKAKK